jgi:hypothetical protein
MVLFGLGVTMQEEACAGTFIVKCVEEDGKQYAIEAG